jgi:SNF2 family DNA or RNA helicase
MAFVETNGNVILVQTEFTEKEMIKAIPGSRWDPDDKIWTVPLTYPHCLMLRGVFGKKLKIGTALNMWARTTGDATRTRASIRDLLEFTPAQTHLAEVIDPLSKNLRPYQVVGASFLHHDSGLLADEVGTGKTIQSLSAMRRIGDDAYPAIVICPNSLKLNWQREAKKWLPGCSTYVVTGSAVKKREILKSAAQDPKALVIINIESVKGHSRLASYGNVTLSKCRECSPYGEEGLKPGLCHMHLKELNHIPFKTVIVDEAHRIKDPKSQQTRAIWAVAHADSVRWRWALTGTPIANSPADLWSVMHFIDSKAFPTKTKWIDRYCLTTFNSHGGLDVVGLNPERETEFRAIVDPYIRRMTKSMVLSHLPKQVYLRRDVIMTPKQTKVYKEMEKFSAARMPDGQLMVAPNDLVTHTRLLQLASSFGEVEWIMTPKHHSLCPINCQDTEHEKCIVTLTEPSPKLDEMEDLIAEFALNDESCIIAAVSSQLIDMAATRLDKLRIPYGKITGDVSQWKRDIAVQDFQAGKTKIMLLTISAGGVGLTLTAARNLVMLQRSWSMIENIQVEGRNHRIGSEIHESINIYDLVAGGTVEEDVFERYELKLMRLEEVTRDRERLIAMGLDTTEVDREINEIQNAYLGVPS